MRVAAVLAIVASLYVAVTTRLENLKLQRDFAAHEQLPLTIPVLTAKEAANFLTVWNEVLDRDRPTRPWVLLGDASGRFGYIQTDGGAGAGTRPVVVQCILFDDAGTPVSKLNLMLPGRREIQLSLPEVALAGDFPVNYDVWVADGKAGIGLTIGDKAANAGGLQGWTNIGEGSTEIGQFMLDGKRLRVVLQAQPLSVTTS